MMVQYPMVEKKMMMLLKKRKPMEHQMRRKKITKQKHHHHKKMNLKQVKFPMHRDYYIVHCRSFSVIYQCKQPKMILKM
jgi:hypothetical protein